MTDKKVLIVYYSHTGNTKDIAQKIHKFAGGDMFEIKPLSAYPVKYDDVVNQAKYEKENNVKPDLMDNGSIFGYDTIYIGSPVWWYTFASPVRTFLSEHDFRGKIIKPFCTHGGGGASNTFDEIRALCPNANVKSGLVSYENTAQLSEIANWVKQ